MGTEYKPQSMQGFIVPMEATFWEEESGEYNGAGTRLSALECMSPVAGDPVADRSTLMGLRAFGEQSKALTAITTRPGLPCLDEGAVVVKRTADSDSDARGCDLPPVPFRWEVLEAGSISTSPHVLRCDDDTLIGVWWVPGTGIQIRRRKLDHTWTAAATVVAYAGAVNPWPCLLQIPGTSRIRLYYWVASGTDWQVGVVYSEDRGQTWTSSRYALSSGLDGTAITSVERLRVAYSGGQVLLIAHVVWADLVAAGYRDRLVSWSSSDGGHVLYHVSTQDGTTEDRSGGYHDIVVMDGVFIVARLRWDTTYGTVVATVSRLASARMSVDTAGEESSTGPTGPAGPTGPGRYLGLRTQPGGAGHDYLLADGDLALVLEDDGALDLFVRRCDTAAAPPGMQACLMLRSASGGSLDSWLTTGQSDVLTGRGQAWYWDEVGASYPYRFAACFQRGRVVLLGDCYNDVGAGTQHRERIGCWFLGGWQNRTMPAQGGQLVPTGRTAFMRPQVALSLPNYQGWTLAVVGAPAIGLTAHRVVVTTGVGESATYRRTGALFTPAEGALLELALQVSSGQVRLRVLAYDAGAPTRYASELRITPTTVELWDVNGAARIGSTWNRTANGRVRVRLDQTGQSVTGLIFEGNDTSEDRFWYPVAAGAALANAGAYVADFLEIVVDESTSCSIDEWPAVWGSYTGDHTIGQTYDQRMPRSVVPGGIYLLDGVRVSAITGPTEIGDSWDIPRSAQYPPEAALPRVTPSPRDGMRTRDFSEMDPTTREVRVAFKIGSTESYPFGRDLGALLDRINAGGASLDIYYAGGWYRLATTGRLGFNGLRRGLTVRVDSGAVLYSAVVRRGELAGALVEFVSGGGPTSNYRMRCESNDRGYISTVSGASYPLTLKVSSADPAAPASPTVRVWPSRHLLVERLSAFQYDFLGYRISVPIDLGAAPASPGPPPEGYLEIGCLCCGPIVYLGTPYGYGRRLETVVNTELTRTRDGTGIADVRGPSTPAVTMSWPDGVPMSRYQEMDAPDFVASATGGPAVGFRWDTPFDVADLVVELQGSAVPVALCPRLDLDGDGGRDHWARGAFLGRITTTEIAIDNVTGRELGNDVNRLQEARVEGEP